MKIRIKTRHGEWITTTDALKKAKWEEVEETARHYVEEEDGELRIAANEDDATWTGIETNNLKAKDTQGNDVLLYFSGAEIWSEEGRDQYTAYPAAKRFKGGEEDCSYWGDEADVRWDGKWQEWVAVCDCIEFAGMVRQYEPAIDYESAVDAWWGENVDAKTRFWMDDARGFANEWTLYIDTQGRERIMVSDLPDSLAIPSEEDEPANVRELSAEDAQKWLVDAVETREDYKTHHGADKCCGAVLL